MKALTVTEFVTARLEEWKARADRASRVSPWVEVANEAGRLGADAGWHVLDHDPWRVLAQCAAMWKIMEGHSGSHVCEDSLVGERWHDPFAADFIEDDPCWNLRALASIWSDHADFREDWNREDWE